MRFWKRKLSLGYHCICESLKKSKITLQTFILSKICMTQNLKIAIKKPKKVDSRTLKPLRGRVNLAGILGLSITWTISSLSTSSIFYINSHMSGVQTSLSKCVQICPGFIFQMSRVNPYIFPLYIIYIYIIYIYI